MKLPGLLFVAKMCTALHLIGLEEHWLSPAVNQSIYEQVKIPGGLDKFRDAGDLRLADMDKIGVNIQVLSHAAGYATDLKTYTAINDGMAEKIAAHPKRFAGFAALPMISPELSAKELRRCMQIPGFKGALIDNHANGTFYEGREYDNFWQTAEELGAPIYIHPTFAAPPLAQYYNGNYTHMAQMALSTSGTGWHFDTAIHVLRLFYAGVFERFPKLKIVLGHFGEGLPFFKERVEWAATNFANTSRTFTEVYGENLWFTTSSLVGVAPLAAMLQNTKLERIMFSMDYPFLTPDLARQWIEMVRKSGIVTEEELEAIAHGNAQVFLGLELPCSTH